MSIGRGAFAHCRNLTSVNIMNYDEGYITIIEPGTFAYCTSLTLITIPDGITAIEYSAFEGCSGLVSVSLPKSIKTIATGAFSNCINLTTVTIEEGVEIRFEVGDILNRYSQFRGCKLDIKSQLALKRAGFPGNF